MAYQPTSMGKKTQFQGTAPESAEYERTVLYALSRDPSLMYAEGTSLKIKDFSEPKHREMFKVIEKLCSLGNSVGPADIINGAQSMGTLPFMGGVDYVMEVCDRFHNEEYIKRGFIYVKNASAARSVIEAGNAMIQEGKAGKTREELLAACNDHLSAAFAGIEFEAPKSAKEALQTVADRYHEQQKNPGKIKGAMVGISGLDNYIRGLRPAYFVIGAASGTGKTALLTNIFWNLVSSGYQTLFASEEMRANEVLDRVVAMRARVNIRDIDSGEMTPDEFARVQAQLPKIAAICDAHSEIYDKSGMSVQSIRARCLAHIRKHGRLDFLLVDYAQSLTCDGIKDSEEYARVTAVSKALRAIYKDLGVCVIVASQLTLEPGAVEKPTNFHLRGSRELMNNADIILLLDVEQKANDRDDGCSLINANFSKGRTRGEAKILLKLDGRYMKFDTVEFPNECSSDEWENMGKGKGGRK